MSAKHAFIDTNVLLSYYSQSDDTLNELEKLNAAAEKGEIILYTNELLIDEIKRNRELRIRDSVKLLGQGLQTNLPRIAEGMNGFRELVDLLRKASKMKQDLLAEVKEAAAENKLHADGLIGRFLNAAQKTAVTKTILKKARRRVEFDNPPGKPGKLGDRVHWEALLAVLPHKSDLILVSADRDFCSPLADDRPHDFLADEWRWEKSGQLELHQGLAPFLKAHFPEIKVPEDFDRRGAVQALVGSGSFQSTHTAIASLMAYSSFSEAEIEDLLLTALGNSQVSWILTDPDVASFYLNLIDKQTDVTKNPLAAQVKAQIKQDQQGLFAGLEEDDNVPF